MDAVVVREGKNLKGRVLGFVLGTVGKGVLGKAFANTVKAIEQQHHPNPPGRGPPPQDSPPTTSTRSSPKTVPDPNASSGCSSPARRRAEPRGCST